MESVPFEKVTQDLARLFNAATMMKFNDKGVYSKTYTRQNGTNQTLIVDNVRYHLAKNKKSMVKVASNADKEQAPANRATARPSTASRFKLVNKQNKPAKSSPATPARQIASRTPKENYRFVSRKSFKLVNRSKSKLIYKRPNRFKFNRLNLASPGRSTSSKFVVNKLVASKSAVKLPADLYRKTYNQSLPKRQDQQFKIQVAQQLRKKALKSIFLNNKLKKNKLKLSTDNTIYCMFFCRTGRCAKIDTCKYKHDKDKVAVCRNFLRGKCEVDGCLLSHKFDPKKMPVCSFYLKGICKLDNCPYRHVNVSANAEICKEFVRGFCVKGDQCKLLHQWKCKSCGSNQCTCKRPFKKPAAGDRGGEQRRGQNGTPDLIELSSDSDMDISDDELAFDKNPDFIPLVSDPDEEPDAEQVDRKPAIGVEESGDSNCSDRTRTPISYDYESDDSWFEDEKNVTLSTKFIPLFLLN